MREGVWDPKTDRVPADILEMVAYAESKNVKLLAYVYPCLPFHALKDFSIGSGSNVVDLSRPEVQAWMIDTMLAFMAKTGSGGWAWDHDIYAGGSELKYGQWRGWM